MGKTTFHSKSIAVLAVAKFILDFNMERVKTRYWDYMFMAFHGNSHGMRRLGRETLPGKALVHSDRLNFHLPSLAVNHLKAK